MTEPFEFRVGDIVSFGGLRGTVIHHHSPDYPIGVDFGLGMLIIPFTKDGRFYSNQTESVLKLIERPSTMEKKERPKLEAWLRRKPVYKLVDGISSIFPEKEENVKYYFWHLSFEESGRLIPSSDLRRAEWLDEPTPEPILC